MMRLCIPLLILLGSQALGQNVTTDAFGILPTKHLGDRQTWAGIQTASDGQKTQIMAQATERALVFVGPKSIVAGAEPGHAVTIGLDQFGNLVDGADTFFNLGFGEVAQTQSRSGISDVLFTPPPIAGALIAGASVEGVQTARADYRVTADLVTVQPVVLPRADTQEPETFGTLTTEPLLDAFGNAVDDGVGMTVVLTDGEGAFTWSSSIVSDGVGQSVLLSREIAGEIQGSLALAGVETPVPPFEIAQIELQPTLWAEAWAEPAIDATVLRIGPLQTTKGYLVPDGLSAAVAIKGSNGNTAYASGWVLDGYLTFVLPLRPRSTPFDVTLEIANNTRSASVELSQKPVLPLAPGAE